MTSLRLRQRLSLEEGHARRLQQDPLDPEKEKEKEKDPAVAGLIQTQRLQKLVVHLLKLRQKPLLTLHSRLNKPE